VSQEQGLSPTLQWATPRPTGQATALDLLRQDTLGEFEILAELGRGGMATVYLAHDIPLDRKVAIKVMSAALMDEGTAERFRREARTAAALNHPHIIPVYAVRERSGLLYFVMKYIPGQSLEPIVKGGTRVSIPMAHIILAQAAAALGYAHRRGVIHRDVKPANIMLDDEGWVVMTDFGIAKVATATGLTMTGVTVGTPAYMSPEQCAGKEVTGASDQYSLGVLAYELITGQKPFTATTAMAMMYSHFNDTPAPLRALRPDCPASLEEKVMRMLAKAPEDRWPSIEEIFGAPSLAHDDPTRQALVTLALSNPNVAIGRLSTPTSPVPPARRSVAATTFPLQAQGATALFGPSASAGAPPGRIPVPRPATSRAAGVAIGVTAALALVVAGYFALRQRPVSAPGADSAIAPVTRLAIDSGTPVDSASTPVPLPTPRPAPPEVTAPVVLASLRLSPATVALETGQSSRIAAQVIGSDGNAMRDHPPITWRTLAPRIVTVSRDGTLRGAAPGRGSVVGVVSGKADTIVVDVTAPVAVAAPVASLTVAPDSVALVVGGAINLAATPRDAAGAALPGREVTWSSTSRFITVSSAGAVVAVSPGTAEVIATAQGKSGRATVVVMPVPVASVVLSGPNTPLKVGETATLSTVARGGRGETLSDRRVTWESSNPAIASVSNGVVTGRAPGSATVTATIERQSASLRVTVATPIDPAAERARATSEITAILNAYAGAITRRNMAQLKAAYPKLPAEDEARWNRVFTEPRINRVEADIEPAEPPQIDSNSATQRVRFKLQIVSSGSPANNSVSDMVARFEQEGGKWQLVLLQPR
jgi:serine/threonine-protein kinase